MEMRQLGATDMRVGVLGFGGAEPEAAARSLGEALDAGLNVIDTAECYLGSEGLIGRPVAGRRRDFSPFTRCGHPGRPGVEDWRPESLLASLERSLQRLRTDRVDLVPLHSGSEDELRKGGVIAKRPIANAAWRYAERPENAHHQPYWDRLRPLDYEFVREGPETATAVAVRFPLSVPGVQTAIVGTARPGRWRENAALIEAGPLHDRDSEANRARWRQVADAGCVGQV